MFKCHLVVGIQHGKLELYIIGHEWYPLASLLYENVNEILDIYLSLVIFWIGPVPLVANFIMSDIVYTKHASLLQIPLDHLGAQDVVGRALNCCSFCWISVGEHGLVAAHLGGAR